MRKGVIMRKMSRFAIWIYSKFTKSEIEFLIKELSDILKNRNPKVKPKDDFKEKHPHYRKCYAARLSQRKCPLFDKEIYFSIMRALTFL